MTVDYYGDWLKIPTPKRPPNYFDLLALSESEEDLQVIAAAATLQSQRVKAHLNGPQAEQCAKLLEEIAQAKAVLSNPEQRAKYVASLKPKSAAPLPANGPAAARPGAKNEPWWKAEIHAPAAKGPPAPATKPAPHAVKASAPKIAPAAKPDSRPNLPDELKVPLTAARPRKSSNQTGMLLVAGGIVAALAVGGVIAIVVLSRPSPSATTQPVAAATTKTDKPTPPAIHNDLKEIAHNADPVELLPKLEEAPATSRTSIEPRAFKRHTAIVQALALAPNGRRFLSASMDQSVLDWNIDDAVSFRRHTFKNGAAAVAYMPNGRQAVCCDENGVLVFDLATNAIQRRLPYPRGNAQCLAAGNDGQHVLVAGSDGTLHWWDVAQPKPERDIDISDSVTVNSVALSVDGQRVAAACSDGKVGVWDIATRRKLWLSLGHPGGATCVAFSPDGQRVASVGLDKTAVVWAAGDGKLIKRLLGHEQIALSVAFLSDGKQVVSGGRDATVRLWDVTLGKNVRTFPAPAAVHCLAVDREDRFVLAGGFGGNLQLIPLKDALSDPSLQEKPPETRYPVPGAAELNAATIAVKNAYKGEWESTKPEEVAILLDWLLTRTAGKETPPTRFVLFQEARRVALKAGKLPVALKTADDLEKWFAIEGVLDKAAVLSAAAALAPAATQKDVIDAAQALLPSADKDVRPDLAKQLLQAMADAAKRSESAELVKRVDGFQRHRLDEAATRDRTAKLLAILKEKPDDADANLAFGLMLCSQGNLKDGLPRLVKGSDKVLAALAAKDLTHPRDLKPAWELADGWWAASKKATDAKQFCLARAKYWYELIKPALSGTEKLEVSSRVLQIDEQLKPVLASSVGTGGAPKPEPRKPDEAIVRKNFNTLRTEAIAKTYWKIDGEYRIEALGLRLPPGKGSMTSTFQLIDNWKLVLVVVPESQVEIEVNQEVIAVEQYYYNTPMEIDVERKGKKLGYNAGQRTRVLANNAILLKDDRLGPSTITIRSTDLSRGATKRDGMLVQSIIVSGPIKISEEKEPAKEKPKAP